VLPGCEYFRATESELETAKRTWIASGKSADDFPLAIAQVEFWLGGKTREAVKARSHPSHSRQLHATWVLKKVNDEIEERSRIQQRITGKPIRANSNSPPPTRQEIKRAELKAFIEEAEIAEGKRPPKQEITINVTPRG